MDIKEILESLYNEEEESPKYVILVKKFNEKYKGDKEHLKKSIKECKKSTNSFFSFKSCIIKKLKLDYKSPSHEATQQAVITK
jgi:arsenate reductase-like glutaredoxin family protein